MKESSKMLADDEGFEELQLIEADAAAATDEDSLAAARHARIALAAYLRAEARGFSPGSELDDWLQAEREVGRQPGVAAA
jgi:hypothetical protein